MKDNADYQAARPYIFLAAALLKWAVGGEARDDAFSMAAADQQVPK